MKVFLVYSIENIRGEKMYKDFAYIYDALMKDVDYEKWTSYIEAIFQSHGLKPESIVDLACGTGGVTNILAKRGYQVTGVDISEDMLASAREKARKSGLRVPYICQNIINLELHHPVDAITCMCDGFNYILDKQDMKSAFIKIYSYLKPGGLLVFDISSYYKLSSVLGNNIMADTGEDISLIWYNKFIKKDNTLEMNLTFFIKEGNYYKRSDETHLQKAYQQDEIIELLTECNFTNVTCLSPFSMTPPQKRSQRIFFTAVK